MLSRMDKNKSLQLGITAEVAVSSNFKMLQYVIIVTGTRIRDSYTDHNCNSLSNRH